MTKKIRINENFEIETAPIYKIIKMTFMLIGEGGYDDNIRYVAMYAYVSGFLHIQNAHTLTHKQLFFVQHGSKCQEMVDMGANRA